MKCAALLRAGPAVDFIGKTQPVKRVAGSARFENRLLGFKCFDYIKQRFKDIS